MNADGIDPRTYLRQDALYVWALIDPANPTLVGTVGLSHLVSDCATFTYAPDWWNFPLSEDLPLVAGQLFSASVRSSAPGPRPFCKPTRGPASSSSASWTTRWTHRW